MRGLPIYLFVEDLVILFGGKRSKGWCYRRYREIKDAMGLTKRQFVSVKKYCEYEGVTATEVYETLGFSKDEIERFLAAVKP